MCRAVKPAHERGGWKTSIGKDFPREQSIYEGGDFFSLPYGDSDCVHAVRIERHSCCCLLVQCFRVTAVACVFNISSLYFSSCCFFCLCNFLFRAFACQNIGLLFHPLLPLFSSGSQLLFLVAASKRIPLTLLSGVTIRRLMKSSSHQRCCTNTSHTWSWKGSTR